MKSIIHLLLLFGFLGSHPLSAQNKDSAFENLVCHEQHAAATLLRAPNDAGIGLQYNVHHYRCFWEVDPAVHYIQGAVTTLFSPTTGTLDTLDFDFASNMQVDSIMYHQQLLAFDHNGSDVLRIPMPAPIASLDSITVYYQGSPVTGQGFGSFITNTHNGGTPVMWTLSEPLGAKQWWPCKQNLNDKADSLDVFVKVPNQYKVAGNGLLQSVSASGDKDIYHWHSNYPIATYLVAFAATDYVVIPGEIQYSGGSFPFTQYVYPESVNDATNAIPNMQQMMGFFNEKMGLYPFHEEKYGQAQFGFGGGQEHQTMTFVINFNYDLMAHELAHQWFGDKITCGSWQDIWLNEGFATYFEGLTREAFFTEGDWLNWKKSKHDNITSQPGGSVFCADTSDIYRVFSARLSYFKGAYVLHMLRWVMGDDAFFQGIYNYATDPALAYSFAKTPDFKAHMEAASGMDLTSFFNQWVYGEGYPVYQINAGYNCGFFEGELKETTTVPASVPFFDIPVPIRLYGSNGETADYIIYPEGPENNYFNFFPPFCVDSAAIDPDYRILSNKGAIGFYVASNDVPVSIPTINASPNPAHGYFYLSGESMPSDTKYTLLDALGKTCLNGQIRASDNYWSEKIDIEPLPPGVYFVKIQGGKWEKGFRILGL